MTAKQLQYVQDTIDQEGFEYGLLHYTNFPEIALTDGFQKLRKLYEIHYNELNSHVDWLRQFIADVDGTDLTEAVTENADDILHRPRLQFLVFGLRVAKDALEEYLEDLKDVEL